jgi:hypothetical protein
VKVLYFDRMKLLLPSIFFLLAVSLASAISVDEVVKLSKLHTSDEVIIQTIQKGKLDKPLTSKDVVYLKEQGVSDAVISALMEKKDEKIEKSDAWRVYHTTNKKGRQVTVVTNLDEKGHRMGGELPPEKYVPQEAENKNYQLPQEIHVTIENAPPPERPERDDYDQEQPPPPPGVPLYNYGYPSYYLPYSPYGGGYYPNGAAFFQHFRHFRNQMPLPGFFPGQFQQPFNQQQIGQPNWNYNAGYTPAPRTFHPQPQQSVPGSFAGLRPTR